ncbi:VWA domain-containing protein [Streptomyces sp. NPDC060020]|uniref:vWA domain-containing protein n=1 Tax=unclassified Streptomyces TaxID=2593676 RepID=UPI00368035C8
MQLLPFYMVCDESGSMGGDPIDAINNALPELYDEISSNPTVSDKTRFCLIGFSSEARVLQPLADLSELTGLPALQVSGLTHFGHAFETLRLTMEQDVARLKAEGHQVFRPVVFFLSDGIPTDSWAQEYAALTGPAARIRPHIVAFGIGECDRATITQVATFKAFIQKDATVSPAAALREFATALTKSIVHSVSGAAPGGQGPALQVADTVPGFTSIPLDTV